MYPASTGSCRIRGGAEIDSLSTQKDNSKFENIYFFKCDVSKDSKDFPLFAYIAFFNLFSYLELTRHSLQFFNYATLD